MPPVKVSSGESPAFYIPEYLAAGRFKVLSKLGSGGYGVVCKAKDLHRNCQLVAIKLEFHSNRYSNLWNETQVYRALEGGVCVPRQRYYGKETINDYNCNVLVVDLLGLDLWDLYHSQPHRFQLKKLLDMGIQMVERVQYLHKKGYLHHDIKPDNFVVGTGANRDKVYLIDLGLATKFTTPTGRHISDISGPKIISGCHDFLSSYVMLGKRASRRDDLISVGYTLLFLFKGELPWTGMRHREHFTQVIKMKAPFPNEISKACQACPQEFALFLKHCYNLTFKEQPDYDYLKGLFRNLLEELEGSSRSPPKRRVGQRQAKRAPKRKAATAKPKGNERCYYVTRFGRSSKPVKRLCIRHYYD